MEKRITKKFDNHILNFKDEIKNWIENNNVSFDGDQNKCDFLNFIYNFEKVKLSSEDFSKRKRMKNIVPGLDRCCACRANGEQCTRRRQVGINFCGTHSKGAPHGIMEFENNKQKFTRIKKIILINLLILMLV